MTKAENRGLRFKMARENKGFTQEQLSMLVDISRPMIASYEKGTKTPSLEVALRMCKVLELDANIL